MHALVQSNTQNLSALASHMYDHCPEHAAEDVNQVHLLMRSPGEKKHFVL